MKPEDAYTQKLCRWPHRCIPQSALFAHGFSLYMLAEQGTNAGREAMNNLWQLRCCSKPVVVVGARAIRALHRSASGACDPDSAQLPVSILLDIELDLLPVSQGLEAPLGDDAGVVHKVVIVLRADEAESALWAEELHGARPFREHAGLDEAHARLLEGGPSSRGERSMSESSQHHI
eukprot:CAMPEP_0194765578 /NCGR_PEP_ID=MMETSP0323_2-20130528/26933_1 /TAXON_ID=2866 ORGANISM="Crypthecodinium cohnii, Strain Seligo" /NCGR_SAMPLE_ID=MMETSP0323_2 /ASSEMBLY_ACC=CAM_ASM_000346 /LENGTH=176 /DNA_ID=CAMNT_0039695375 /DNA_START=206 /DNA_END=736 /DNA_ORIENTATION=+